MRSIARLQREAKTETPAMSGAKVLSFVIILSPLLASLPAAGADHCCESCGCRKVKKVTRLVKTMKEIKIPRYQCSPSETFYQEKGKICHTGYRCDTVHGGLSIDELIIGRIPQVLRHFSYDRSDNSGRTARC